MNILLHESTPLPWADQMTNLVRWDILNGFERQRPNRTHSGFATEVCHVRSRITFGRSQFTMSSIELTKKKFARNNPSCDLRPTIWLLSDLLKVRLSQDVFVLSQKAMYYLFSSFSGRKWDVQPFYKTSACGLVQLLGPNKIKKK